MGLLDFIIRKNETNSKTRILPEIATNDEKANAILEEDIKNFFPNSGHWYDNCFSRPSEVWSINLPCHLRDNAWMSQLLHKVLKDKKIYIKPHAIKQFMDNSETFAELRHQYELKIVEWQINWVMSGGTNWMMPKGTDEFSLIFSEDYDKIIRGGIVKTLRAIGMDAEVIEEGLEKYADIWRPSAMERGFTHKYEPVAFMVGTPGKADAEHKQNWLADREYQYYQAHKNLVDNYGTRTPAMQMTPEEHAKLVILLEKQNKQRSELVEQCRTAGLSEFYTKLNTPSTTNQNGDILSK